mgnify:CR=1 FL=1
MKMPIKPKKLQKFQRIFATAILAAVLLLPVLPIAVSADYWDGSKCVTSSTQNMPACPATTGVRDLKSLINAFIGIINLIQKFLVALSIFIIIWGTFRYLVASGDKERLTKARDVIVYGLLGIVIMYTIIGIIAVLLNTFKVDSTSLPPIPQFTRP